jgi:hypothetical protein
MTDFDELKQTKAQCLRDITEALPDYVNRLNSIDTRLLTYIEDAISNNASHANLYELLGIRKEFRLLDSYDIDPERVKRSLRAIEGKWRDGRHLKGGLKFSTPRGSQHVRLMPFQAWLIFEIYAFKVDVSMEHKMVLKHRYVWEQANGPIPDGHNIAFRDGNRQNCDLSNLYLISREEAAREQIKNETAEHRAARVVKATATRNETIRRDRIRIHWGFEPKSRLVKRW